MSATSIYCGDPMKVLEEVIKDDANVLDLNVLQDQWSHFRLTDATVRSLYGDAPKSLKSDGQLMSRYGYDENYRDKIRPIFQSFVGLIESDVPTVRQLLIVTSDPGSLFLVIHKSGEHFLLGLFDMNSHIRSQFETQFKLRREKYYPGYTGRLLDVAIFDCSTEIPSLAMDTLAKYTNQLTK